MQLVFINTAGEDFFGLSEKLLKERSYKQFLQESYTWVQAYKQTKSPSFIVQNELVWLQRYPKDPMAAFATAHPLADNPDLLIIELVPASKTLQQNHERAMNELSESSRRLLRNLAHEIKNPLGGIRGAAQLLQAELDEPDKREYTEVVISEADRLQALVDKILAPYRSPFQPQQLNIHEVLERVRVLIESEFSLGLTVVRDYDISVPEIRADRGQLTQVFLNLFRNAAEALELKIAEGTAQIRVSTRVVHHVNIGHMLYKTALNVHVVDNGPGIPEKIAQSVFYPLVSGREGGSGLGLSLVQSFIEQHGASIQVNSKPGCTDFSILFPLTL